MKNSLNQHCYQTGVADGTSPLLSMVTATLTLSNETTSFLLEGTQIAKPAETDFEQSMLSMFDNKKATNLTQSL